MYPKLSGTTVEGLPSSSLSTLCLITVLTGYIYRLSESTTNTSERDGQERGLEVQQHSVKRITKTMTCYELHVKDGQDLLDPSSGRITCDHSP